MAIMITEEELKTRLDKLSEDLKRHEEARKGKGWINKVDPLTLDYDDYKKTKLWRDIKQRVFLRDNNVCYRCLGKADVVHHICYDNDAMLGKNDKKLVSLCSGCHEIVHFTTTEARRPYEGQLAALTDLTFNEPLPKVDMRSRPWNRPKWKRLTEVQKQAYLHEYNKKMMARQLERQLSNNSVILNGGKGWPA